MAAAIEELKNRKFAIYVLGAGFSVAAGLPIANEVWMEVKSRAERMSGRAEKFRHDVQAYIAYREDCFGDKLTPENVNFEEFLGFLDIEFHLGLRGGDTWSRDGNETQVIIKTLIGQVLSERTPSVQKIPSLYLDFAKKLRPDDIVLTFNYDILLERALDVAGVKYRLMPNRYDQVTEYGSFRNAMHEDNEVIVIKLHGSVDWFSRQEYSRTEKYYQHHGYTTTPPDPIFAKPSRFDIEKIVSGPHPQDDPMHEMFRIKNVEDFYRAPPWFSSVPSLINPSTTKVLWSRQFGEFWSGLGRGGALNFSMAIIGYSLPLHDDYARQVIYSLTTNYQQRDWGEDVLKDGRVKSPLLLVDFQKTEQQREKYKLNYAFVDWNRATTCFDGFNGDVVNLL